MAERPMRMHALSPTVPIRAQHNDSAAAAPVLDQLARPLQQLRISLTDRCNFRCIYCMPKAVFNAHYPFLNSDALLRFDEIVRISKAFVALGVTKIRLTGGEPLLRKDIERLIEQLAALRTAQGHDIDLALTTNGLLLRQKASALRNAGLSRLTVSLDALDNALFQRMSDTDHHVGEILEGIAAGEAAGFSPIKINMVVQRNINESQIVPMAQYFKRAGHILRFIEFMDVGNTNGWRASKVVPSSDILAQLHQAMPIEPVDQQAYGEVAKRWRYLDGEGKVGAISSVTQAFCHDCTRARLSADGQFFKCLFGQHGIDLRSLVRDHTANEDDLRATIAGQWRVRRDQYSVLRDQQTSPAQHAEMSYLGG